MQIRPLLLSAFGSIGPVILRLFAPAPPDLDAPPLPPHDRKIDREHDETQGNHPKSEDRQESHHSAADESDAEHDAPQA